MIPVGTIFNYVERDVPTKTSRCGTSWQQLKVISVNKYQVECGILNSDDQYTIRVIPLYLALKAIEFDKPYNERMCINGKFEKYVKSLKNG